MVIIINGKYPKELNELTTIANDAWIIFQPDAVIDEVFKIKFSNMTAAFQGSSAVGNTYNDIASLTVDQSNQSENTLYKVINPTGDPAFAKIPINKIKGIYYAKKAASTASITDYDSIALPIIGTEADPFLGSSLDANTVLIKFNSTDWTSAKATIQAVNNALKFVSPYDLILNATGVIRIDTNKPAEISKVFIDEEGVLFYMPSDPALIQSDIDVLDIAISTTFIDSGLLITSNQAIDRGAFSVNLDVESIISGPVTAFTDQENGTIKADAISHGMSIGTDVLISASTNYNGTYKLLSIPSSDSFIIAATFVATETATFTQAKETSITVELRKNGVQISTFTRNIAGVNRENFSGQITSSIALNDAFTVFVKTNGTDFIVKGTTTDSKLKIIAGWNLVNGSGTTINGNKVDLGGNLTAQPTTIKKQDDQIFQIISQDASNGEQQELILSNTELWLHYGSTAGDINIQIGAEKSGAGVPSGGGLYIYAQEKAAVVLSAGINFGAKDGIIKVGDVFVTGRASHMQYDSDYSAKINLLSQPVKDLVIPHIKWIKDNIAINHDYKEWHLDGINGSDSSNGGLNTPVKTLQQAIDLWENDPITEGVITIHRHTGIGNGILTAVDSNFLTIQGTGGVFTQNVNVLTINDGVDEDIPLILRNIEVTTLNIVQTGVLNNGFISYNAVVRTLNITVNDSTRVACTGYDNSEIRLVSSQTFLNISVLENSRLLLSGSNAYIGVIGVHENSSLYVNGAAPSITTLNANQSHVSIGSALTITGDFTHTGVSFDNYTKIAVSGNEIPKSGEWADNPINFGVVSIKTLSTGIIASGTNRNLVIAAETGTADDLIEITGLALGDKVLLRADTGDTITIKHNDAGATIKILIQDNADFILDEQHPVEFIQIATNELVQVYDETTAGLSNKLDTVDTTDQSVASSVDFKRGVNANNDANSIKAFTATPTFDFKIDGNDQQMTLTGNVTTFAVSNNVGSANYDVWMINDGTAGRTVAAPTGWTLIPGGDTHDEAANAINLYQFKTSPSNLIKRFIIKNM